MLSMFEKLINEHGSSTILKERIMLINDKYEVLETKLKLAEQNNVLLIKENEELKEKINQLEEHNNALSGHANDLPDIQGAILKILFSNGGGVDERVLANSLKIELGEVNYHTDELLEKGLIEHPSYTMGNSFTGTSGTCEHYISKDGRKYVVEVIGL